MAKTKPKFRVGDSVKRRGRNPYPDGAGLVKEVTSYGAYEVDFGSMQHGHWSLKENEIRLVRRCPKCESCGATTLPWKIKTYKAQCIAGPIIHTFDLQVCADCKAKLIKAADKLRKEVAKKLKGK